MLGNSSKLAELMGLLLGPNQVLTSQAAQRAYDCDAYTVDKSAPQIVVLPESTNQVQKVVQLCLEEKVPFTPRGAGTGLSGGALAALGGVIISTKRLNKILEVDLPNQQLLAQSGAVNKRISDWVKGHALHFAPDPSSQSVSTIGGNIAENSGGPHTLKYGVTINHVLQVTLVNPDGEIETVGSRVEGGPGPELLSLIVGAEGTTGIVTEAWVKLTPNPLKIETALVAFPSVRDATEAVASIVASGIIPSALELMDKGILAALHSAFGLEYPFGCEALLLIECDSTGDFDPTAEITAIRDSCQAHRSLSFSLAQNEEERAKLWVARKKGIGAMGRLAPTIVTHDGVIPRSKLPEMLDFVYQVAEKHKLGVANLFHAGDGNLHPCFYFDDREPGVIDHVVEAGEEILRRCVELGGSVSGEHGIGVEKQDLMKLMFSASDLSVQALAKSVFNSGTLCNPCKVLPDQKSCVEHKARWRGVAW